MLASIRSRTFCSRVSLCRNLKIKNYWTVILIEALYGCETWSSALMEEHRLRVSENRVLRRIFPPKRDEVTGEWSFITCAIRRT
jgi:hypothetical protein